MLIVLLLLLLPLRVRLLINNSVFELFLSSLNLEFLSSLNLLELEIGLGIIIGDAVFARLNDTGESFAPGAGGGGGIGGGGDGGGGGAGG